MKSDYEKPCHIKERRSARHGIASQATLRHQREYEVEVKVRNLSQCGFMAECAEPVQIGSHVALEVPGIGTVDAQVRWQVGSRMGGMFRDPISLDDCEWTAVKSDSKEAA
jgi:hypothetical protein